MTINGLGLPLLNMSHSTFLNKLTTLFDKLVKINTENDYLPAVYSRGKAAHSDPYFFTEAGIPSFFIYLMGEYSHYHVPADNMDNLQLGPYYDKSFLLIRDFIILLNE